jgi:prepilin signal peptidase PulO-like enzyme (type II secretory pathway)
MMLVRVLVDFYREKEKAWKSLDDDARTKKCMTIIEWNFKYIGWCALTAAIAKYASHFGSNAALWLSLYMTLLLSIFMALPFGNWVVQIATRGKKSDHWKEKVIWFGFFLVVSAAVTFFLGGVMGQVFDLIISLSR